MPELRADNIFHPPSGSSVPGKREANPYIFYPPEKLRALIRVEKDPVEWEKMDSALRQWERIYVYPGYPYRLADCIRKIAFRLAEVSAPAINLPYYQDSERSEGYEGILEDYKNIHDNDDEVRFNLKRPGERPVRDVEVNQGDFLSPSEPVFDMGKGVVSPRGDGPDPEGMWCPFPPTGGDIDAL